MGNHEVLNPQTLGVLKRIFDNKIPVLLMMQGIPGSGKSTIAEEISNIFENTTVFSSDKLRQELFGDVNNQKNNNNLFIELHRRIKRNLSEGNNVIYDATNINKKQRIAFINELKKYPCYKVNVLIMTPYNKCLERDHNRNRTVGEKVIRKMYHNWQPPHYSEGFDEIIPIYADDYDYEKEYNLDLLIDIMMGFDQKNSHHQLTLGEHCIKAYKFMETYHSDNPLLKIAALLHDVGKLYTQSHYNMKGEYSEECHYYNHNCVGAYECFFYINYLGDNTVDIPELIYIANLIYYHMHPYVTWVTSEKCLRRDADLLGAKLFSDICYLHDADLFAH